MGKIMVEESERKIKFMMKSERHSFWQALVVALVIFWSGILLGFLFESNRANNLEDFYFSAETDIFDVQLSRDILSQIEFNCDIVLRENIDFADRIFEEAKELEKYDAANKITDDVLDLHKRYDLLRVMLWNNAIFLQEECPGKTNVVVYLYEYKKPSVDQGSRQIAFNKVLSDTKEKHGDKVLLIPIAADTGVKSLELFKEKYDMWNTPVVLVNGENKFDDLFKMEELERVLVL
jgi:hypothetical protein